MLLRTRAATLSLGLQEDPAMTTNVVQISVIVTMSKLIDLKTLLIVPRCIFLVCKNTRIIDVMVQAYVKPTLLQSKTMRY